MVAAYTQQIWALAFLSAFLETLLGIGLLFPGSTLLLFMGVLAGRGVLDMTPLLGFAFLGALTGDNVNYWIGRRMGKRLLHHRWLHLSDALIGKTETFLNQQGAASLFIARFVPGMKESMSFVGGSVNMRYGTFLFWDTLGAMGWSVEFIGIGYLFSKSLKLAEFWLSRTALIIIVLIFLGTVLYFLLRYFYLNRHRITLLLSSLGHSFAQNPYVKRWMAEHPESVTFIKKRFSRKEFSGLPLTLLGILFLYVVALFLGLVEDLITSDPIVAVDQIIATALPQLRTPELTKWFTLITLLGREEMVAFAAGIIVGLLWYYRYRLYIIPFLFTLAGSIATVLLTKLAFHRPRPDTALYMESTYAFPSAHAVISVTLYGFAAFLLIHFCDNPRTKRNIFVAAVLLDGLIGLSRIYLGEHYLSDVYGGYLIGLLWLIAGMTLSYRIEQRTEKYARTQKKRGKMVLWLAVTSFFLFFFFFSRQFHYRPVVSVSHNPVVVNSPLSLFAKPHSQYVQNPFGFDTWPINVIIAANDTAAVTKAFEKAQWRPATSRAVKMLPIFWDGAYAALAFEKKAWQHQYFIKIFKTDAVSKDGLSLFVAIANAIEGMKWGMVPWFSPDIDEARAYVLESLKAGNYVQYFTAFELDRSCEGEDILDEEYFTDGKVVMIVISKEQNHANSAYRR